MQGGGSAWVNSASPLTVKPNDDDHRIVIEKLTYDGTGTIVFNSKTFNMLTTGEICEMAIDKGATLVVTPATGWAVVRWRQERIG